MNKQEVLKRIEACGVVAIARMEDASQLMHGVEALKKGGVDVFEVTMSVPGALDIVREAVRQLAPEVVIGAGTVLDGETARLALLAGAAFLVTPCLTPSVIEVARRYDVAVTPGGLTPSEILTAWEAGADAVKVFPAHTMGPKYLKDIHGPLPQIPLLPTGGINLDNAADYIRNGALALGMTALLDKALLAERKFDQITDNARRLVDVVHEARAKR